MSSRRRSRFPFALLACLLLAAAPASAEDKAEAEAAKPAASAPSCITAKCHTNILKNKNVHDPAEGCTDCHDAVATPHPQKGKKTFGLLNDVPDLCYSCHDEYGKKKTVHSPVEDGECTECHDPHSSPNETLLKKPGGEICLECHDTQTAEPQLHGPVADHECLECHEPHETDTKALLKKEGNALCYECHDSMAGVEKQKTVHSPLEDGCTECHDPHGSKFPAMLPEKGNKVCFSCHDTMEATVNDSKVTHGAMEDEKGCLLCHSPHASDNASLLEKPVRETCLECHDQDVPVKVAVLHGKGNSGDCADCHTPHGGDVETLLEKPFPEGLYQPWNDKAYPLCFGCHERELVTAAQTSSATGFRDGKKNLHSIHVGDETKGRSCILCHSVHGSDNPKLIQETVPFGKWKMPLKFQKTATGGSCAPGCHRLYGYDRENPGRKPKDLKTKDAKTTK